MTYKAGELLPNGMIYLSRIDDQITIVNPKDEDGLFTWDNAMKHVADMEMDLPNRVEFILIFENKDAGAFKGTFREDNPYWTSRRYYHLNAYYQWVVDGNQFILLRNVELPARPVRRLNIQSFNNLFGEG